MKVTTTMMGKGLAALVMVFSVCSVASGAGEVPKAWTKMEPGALRWEASRLKGQLPFSKEILGQFGAYAAQRYSQAKGTDKFDLKQWVPVAAEVGSHMPDPAKGTMAADIRKAFFGDGQAAADLTLNQCRDTAAALHALGVEDASQLLADRVSKELADDKLGLGEVLAMHRNLHTPFTLEARARLAENVQVRCLTDPETIRSVTLEGWSILVQAFHPTLAEETKELWADKLFAVFTTEQVLGELSAEDREVYSQMLQRLDAPERSKEVFAAWVIDNDAWKSGDIAQLASMAGRLAGGGGSAGAARRALAEHIQQTYLAEGRSVETIAPELWFRLIRPLEQDLAGEERKRWAARFLGALERTSPGEEKRRDQLSGILGLLGVKVTPDRPISVSGVLTDETWLTWEVVGLIDLGRRLSALEPGDETVKAWPKLVGHIENKYLTDDETVRSVSCGQWWDLARYYAKGRTDAASTNWAARIRAAYIGNVAVFNQLGTDEVIALGKALVLLNDAEGTEVVREWLSRKS